MNSPAFQFYAQDFLVGTAGMPVAVVGAYIRLLCYQWCKGGLENDNETLMELAVCDVTTLTKCLPKFSLCNDGLLRNEKLEKVRKERQEWITKSSLGGKKSALKRWGSRHKRRVRVVKQCLPNGINQSGNQNVTLQSSVFNLQELPPKPHNNSTPTSAMAQRVSQLFHRRVETKWDPKEVKVFRSIGDIDETDMAAIERYYAAERKKGESGIHRRDLATFLNNFRGELDRARTMFSSRKTKPITQSYDPDEWASREAYDRHIAKQNGNHE